MDKPNQSRSRPENSPVRLLNSEGEKRFLPRVTVSAQVQLWVAFAAACQVSSLKTPISEKLGPVELPVSRHAAPSTNRNGRANGLTDPH
jgi:hypothetical protein